MKSALFGLSVLIAMFVLYAMYWNSQYISGPFVFGDELEYLSYGRDLRVGADLSRHTQYGMLYPAIIPIALRLGDLETAYWALRIFNIVIFTSSVIPAFLLARALFPDVLFIRIWFPIFAVTSPVGGFTYILWADPLYYTLLFWAVFFIFCFHRRPSVLFGCIVGVLLGLLFHAKPGAGVIVQGATFVSLLARFVMTPSASRLRQLRPILVLLLICAALTVPGVVRTLSLGAGPTGYSYASEALAGRIAELGLLQIAQEVFLSVFYQVSYLFVGTWGLLGVLVVMPIFRWPGLSPELRALAVFVLVWIAGIVALSSIGMTSFPSAGYWMPNGRYQTLMFPAEVLMSLRLLTLDPRPTQYEKLSMVAITIILGTIVVFATPLLVLAPYTFVNNPDLALIEAIVFKGSFIWNFRYDPSLLEVTVCAAAYTAIGSVGILMSKWRRAVFVFAGLLLLASIAVSVAEHRYVRMIGESQNAFNDASRLLAKQASNPRNTVAFDRKLEGSSIYFIGLFWGRAVGDFRYMSPGEIAQSIGTPSAPRFFVSQEALNLPTIFSSSGLSIYELHPPPSAE